MLLLSIEEHLTCPYTEALSANFLVTSVEAERVFPVLKFFKARLRSHTIDDSLLPEMLIWVRGGTMSDDIISCVIWSSALSIVSIKRADLIRIPTDPLIFL